jgi:hypothetical protein
VRPENVGILRQTPLTFLVFIIISVLDQNSPKLSFLIKTINHSYKIFYVKFIFQIVFNIFNFLLLFSVIIISSTYTRTMVVIPSECLTNIEESTEFLTKLHNKKE